MLLYVYVLSILEQWQKRDQCTLHILGSSEPNSENGTTTSQHVVMVMKNASHHAPTHCENSDLETLLTLHASPPAAGVPLILVCPVFQTGV